MSTRRQNPDTLEVAVLTVCVERATAEQIVSAAEQMPWAVVHGEFEEYFSSTRRPMLTHPILNAQACIAVIDFDDDPEQALETAAFLHEAFYNRIAIVAISASTDMDLLVRSMRAGCSEYLHKPFDRAQFEETIARLNGRWSSTLGHAANAGKVLSFFGAKGGAGTTTLCMHLAVFLVQCFKKKVLLIDNHTQLGHVCLYLGLDSSLYHFSELVRNVNRLDHDLLRGFVAVHSSGLDVLSSPDAYGGSKAGDPDAVERTLDFLRGEYDFVLLDCEASFENVDISVIEKSDYVYMIATPEIGAIRDLSRYVDGLIQNEQATDKLQVVVNRYSSRDAVSLEQIEKAIRLPVAVKISNSYGELVRAINVGEPVAPDKKSDFSAQLMKWASTLTGMNELVAAEPVKKRFSLW